MVHDEEGGGYGAEVPELPGCFGSGETLETVERDIKLASEAYIESLRPRGTPVLEGKVAVEDRMVRRWEIAVA